MQEQLSELIMPLSEALVKQLSDLLAKQDKQQVTFYWIELTVYKLLAAFALQLIVGLIQLRWGRGYEGAYRDCPSCGGPMKFQRYSRRQLLSSFGPLAFQRAYYYCRHCRASSTPLDKALQLSPRELSPRLERVIAFQAAHLSFAVVEKSLRESYELELSDEAIRQAGEAVGQQARDWEDQQAQHYQREPLPRCPPHQPPQTWVLEIDGKKVGFQDGSWNEVKVGVLYQLSDRVEPQTGRHELVKRELVARRCSWEQFVPHFWAAMHRAGIRQGDRLVAIADGADSLESIFAYVAPQAQRIRDFYHVAERVYALGELRFGAESPSARRWIHLQLHKLKDSELAGVVRSIAHLKFESPEQQAKREQVLTYFRKHRSAMDYGQYRAEGLPLGSGAVEGGCRLIGLRTNGCGRRWAEPGCDQVVALRAAVLNDRLDLLRPKPQTEKSAA
jgi:hypothetical protein